MSDSSVTGTRDELAAALSVPTPTHPLRVHTSRVSERAVRSVTVDVVGDRELGVASRLRPIGADLELIRLIPLDQLDVDEHGFAVWRPGQTVQNVSLLLRHGTDGWRIAGPAAGCRGQAGHPSSRPSSVRTTDHSDLACSQGDTRTRRLLGAIFVYDCPPGTVSGSRSPQADGLGGSRSARPLPLLRRSCWPRRPSYVHRSRT
jgi:hypothetical protein